MEKIKIEIKWGVIFIVFQLLWFSTEKALGFLNERIDLHEVVTYFFIIPAFAMYYLGLREKREKFYAGKISYKQSFIAGLWITVVAFILTPIQLYLAFKIITPDFFQNMITYTVSVGKLTQAEAEAYFNFSSYLMQGTMGAIIAGIITSAILSFFIKKS